jgi:hypothetical protein
MLVPDGRRFRAYVDAVLDDLASWDAEIVPLEIGALDSRQLLQRCCSCQPPLSRSCRHQDRSVGQPTRRTWLLERVWAGGPDGERHTPRCFKLSQGC